MVPYIPSKNLNKLYKDHGNINQINDELIFQKYPKLEKLSLLFDENSYYNKENNNIFPETLQKLKIVGYKRNFIEGVFPKSLNSLTLIGIVGINRLSENILPDNLDFLIIRNSNIKVIKLPTGFTKSISKVFTHLTSIYILLRGTSLLIKEKDHWHETLNPDHTVFEVLDKTDLTTITKIVLA
jgi:hypothetical protein